MMSEKAKEALKEKTIKIYRYVVRGILAREIAEIEGIFDNGRFILIPLADFL